MRLNAEQFLDRPPKTLTPLYVIHGAEPLAALEAADSLRKLVREAGYNEREVLTAEPGFDWNRLVTAGNALSLFATKRLLELRIPTGKPGKEGSAAIVDFCKRLPEDTITLVTLPEIDWQTRSTTWFGALDAVAVVIEALPVERAKLPRWLQQRLARQQQTASSEALEFLADRVEGNLLAAKQEIDKLALLCPPGEISLQTIESGVVNVSRFNSFQLAQAIYQGDVARLARMLAGLKAEGEAPPLILWVLTNELRMLLRVLGATRSGRPPAPGKTRDLEQLSRRHTRDSLRKLLREAAKIDRMVKGLDSRDPWDALLKLVTALAGQPILKAA